MAGGVLSFPETFYFDTSFFDRETIFLDHYDWLLNWARQHLHGASGEAEDLVQDLYIRFVQMRLVPIFTDSDQVRAYLYTALKNLFISKKLRSGRDAVSRQFSVDFDSVSFAISAADRSQLLQVRSDLAGVCEYACIRRQTNRAASALILRFFLGYLPTEIMSLLRTKRSNVDKLIETARLEAKAYLTRPEVLHFLSRREQKATSFSRFLPEQPDALFAELQRRLFLNTEGTCLPPRELRDCYLRLDAPAFSTQEVAHLASCRICLNEVNLILGLSAPLPFVGTDFRRPRAATVRSPMCRSATSGQRKVQNARPLGGVARNASTAKMVGPNLTQEPTSAVHTAQLRALRQFSQESSIQLPVFRLRDG
jgi:DNA-directed RNA polymerase specialized sigma24 family protein